MKRILFSYFIIVSLVYSQILEADIMEKDNKLRIKIRPANKNEALSAEIDEAPAPKVEEKPKFIKYIVSKGDTLMGIARRYKDAYDNSESLASVVNQIYSDNPEMRKGTTLEIGQVIDIRVLVSGREESESSRSSLKKYIVQRGDTLFKIAQRFKSGYENSESLASVVKQIYLDNPEIRKGSYLRIGQVVDVRVSADNENEFENSKLSFKKYVVRRGDTLFRIARRFRDNYPNLTETADIVEQIKQDNLWKRDFNTLEPGEILNIKDDVR